MLTTRCPHCSKVFRVRPEQLSVRGGRVRCGHCQQAFSALAHLEEFDDEEIAPVRPSAPTPVPTPAAPVRPAVSAAPARPAAPPVRQSVPPAAANPVAPARPPEPAQAVAPAKPAPAVKPAEAPKPVPPAETSPAAPAPARPAPQPAAPKPVEPARPAAPPKPVEPPKPADAPPPAAAAPRPAPVPRPPVVDPAFVRNAPIPLHESSPLTKLPEISFPALELPPESEQPVEAPAFVALDESSRKAEAPAVGDDFSMQISMPGEDDDVDAVAEPAEPYRSKVAEELGVAPYEPSRELDMGQTVMLEEPLDVIELRPLHNGPESLFEERERQRASHVGVEDRRRPASGRTVWLLGALALSVLILLQLAYVFRMELARAVPDLRPALEQVCGLLGCTVPYPRNAELISLEGHSFNPEDGASGSYRLVLTLLNKAAYPQTWPHVELTITDRFDIAISRRVLKPEEWLPAGQRQQPAFESYAEVTANLALNIGDLPAAGYRLYVFYP